eukprot:m.825924 g.825924  ORF g.825924 m.825924 type:complete len:853 (+) comp59414_c0_seq1:160-2718(+)
MAKKDKEKEKKEELEKKDAEKPKQTDPAQDKPPSKVEPQVNPLANLTAELINQLHAPKSIFAGVAIVYIAGYLGMSVVWAAVVGAVLIGASALRASALLASAKHKAFKTARQAEHRVQGEYCNWLNVISTAIWRAMHDNIVEIIHDQVDPLLEEYKPSGMESLGIHELMLGTEGVQLEYLRTLDTDDPFKKILEVHVRYVEPEFKVVLKSRIGGKMAFTGFDALFEVNSLHVRAKARLTIKMDPHLPIPSLKYVRMSLLAPPELSIKILPIGSIDILKWFPSLNDFILDLITDSVCDFMLAPEYLEIGLAARDEHEVSGLAHGVLLVSALKGSHLNTTTERSGKIKDKKREFAVRVKLAGDTFETAFIAEEDHAVEWNQQLAIPIHSFSSEKLAITLSVRKLGHTKTLASRSAPASELMRGEDLNDSVEDKLVVEDSNGFVLLRYKYVPIPYLPRNLFPPALPVEKIQKAKLAKQKQPIKHQASIALSNTDAPRTDEELRAELQNPARQLDTGLLYIRVHEARGLKSKEVNINCAPYVQIQINGESHWETEVVPKSVTPNWEAMPPHDWTKPCWKEFFVASLERTWINFRVLDDHEKFSGNAMGSVRVNLGSVPGSEQFAYMEGQWLPLDTVKQPIVPEFRYEPQTVTEFGELRVSIIFRAVPVEHLRAGLYVGGDTRERPTKKSAPRMTLLPGMFGGSKRVDLHTGGPLKQPASYPNGGALSFEILEAKGLSAKDRTLFGKPSSDPYVIVKIGGIEVYRTKTKKKTLQPVWELEALQNIVVQDIDEEHLEFVCMDEDSVSDELIGHLKLSLANPATVAGEPAWFAFSDGAVGELKLRISFVSSQQLRERLK